MQKPETVVLKATTRKTGSQEANSLRKNKEVPAVVYGPKQKENRHFSVSEIELEKLLSIKHIQIVQLDFDGKEKIETIIKNVDYQPLTDRPVHVDFYALAEKFPVTITVPLEFTGTAVGVTEGGRLYRPMRSIRIRCLPGEIPAHIYVDITSLGIGDSLHVRNLDIGDIIPLAAPGQTLAVVKPPRTGLQALETVAPAEEEEELEEGAAAEGEETAEEEQTEESSESEE